MEKKYNLISESFGAEHVFLSNLNTETFMRDSHIESVFPGCTQVYHILDSTATFDRQLKPDILNPLKRTSANPFLQIYASSKRKIKRAINLLEEIASEELKEVRGE